MRHFTIAAIVAVLATSAFGALDMSTETHDVALTARRTEPTDATATLVASQSFTTNATVASTGVAKASYSGIVRIVCAFAGNADAAYTNVATILQGPSADVLTNAIATLSHGGDATAVKVYSLDVSTLTQAYFGVSFSGVTDNAAAYKFSASSLYDTVPAAGQTELGAVVDTIDYKGTGLIFVNVGPPDNAASTFAASAVVKSSATSGGSYTAVSGTTGTASGASGGSIEIPYEFGKGNRYIKVEVTTTNGVAPFAASIHSFK
jgi:hypothetical protein